MKTVLTSSEESSKLLSLCETIFYSSVMLLTEPFSTQMLCNKFLHSCLIFSSFFSSVFYYSMSEMDKCSKMDKC